MKTIVLILAFVAMALMLAACAEFEVPVDLRGTMQDLHDPGLMKRICDAGAMTTLCDKSTKRI